MALSAEVQAVAPANRSQIWPPGTLGALFQIWTVNKLARSAWQHRQSLYGGNAMNDSAAGKQMPPFRYASLLDPRVLVGMTQGARKRALRRGAHRLGNATKWYLRYVLRLNPAQVDLNSAEYDQAMNFSLSKEREHRAAYRLGERLRPCPGCDKCEGRRPVNGMMIDIYRVICDGSGVLSARRQGGTSSKPRKLHIFGDLGKSGRPLGQ